MLTVVERFAAKNRGRSPLKGQPCATAQPGPHAPVEIMFLAAAGSLNLGRQAISHRFSRLDSSEPPL